MSTLPVSISDQRRGTLLGVTAYLIWGFAALYWVQLDAVDTRDMLAHRAVWTVVAVVLFLLVAGRLTRARLGHLEGKQALLAMAELRAGRFAFAFAKIAIVTSARKSKTR